MMDHAGLRFAIAKNESPFIFAQGAIEIDYYEYAWGEGFSVRNANATAC